jgi:chemotaxis-related protein WspD
MSTRRPPQEMALLDCWSRIGVSGDRSCERLLEHIHCRNCEVYAGAAQRNLQRAVGAGYRAEWAEHLRQPEAAPGATDSAALAFRIGREWLALPASIVASVAPQAASHRLPHRSGRGLVGIVNVGGKLTPSISLATLLGIDERDVPLQAGRHTFARLVVIEWEGQAYALPVADLHGIVRFAAGTLAAPAATINKGLERYLAGVVTQGQLHIGVLDAGLVGHQLERLLR